MNSLRLAWSLLLIPRLFFTLIFFPLLISVFLVYLQLLLTQVAVDTLNKSPDEVERVVMQRHEDNFIRKIIYGDGKPLPEIEVCRWQLGRDSNGSSEVPPDEARCEPNRLDVALRLENASDEKIAEYKRLLNGNVEHLHICKTCSPDIVISETNGKIATDIRSVWGLMVLGLITFDREVTSYYISSLRRRGLIKELVGENFLHISGFTEPVSLQHLQTRSIVIMNLACILIIALWLALKAHRRVLDYFARSGALLPMVAATGKGTFYTAIWLLTIFRVGAFLLASIPLAVQLLGAALNDDRIWAVFANEPLATFAWLLAVFAGLSFATLIASISDLKHRHQLFSFTYRYLPLGVCMLGALIWLASFLLEGQAVETARSIVTALPVAGIAPVLVAPVLKPKAALLLCHAVLTAALLAAALRGNSQWFAAHLEDL